MDRMAASSCITSVPPSPSSSYKSRSHPQKCELAVGEQERLNIIAHRTLRSATGRIMSIFGLLFWVFQNHTFYQT